MWGRLWEITFIKFQQNQNNIYTNFVIIPKEWKKENNGIDRVFTHADKQGRDYFIKLLKENNFDVKIDNIGNIFGLINFDNSNNYILSGHILIVSQMVAILTEYLELSMHL